jgi:basic amino acid/polyamine antiporter, APA family
MIGTGVFTSLGFQLVGITNTNSIILLWLIGSIISICGALSYAELSTYFNKNGGEYLFLSKSFHPLLGFFSGIVSLFVGFAAPVALAAMAFASYCDAYIQLPPQLIAAVLIIGISLVHSFNTKKSAAFQKVTTVFKISIIIVFIIAGLFSNTPVNAISFNGNFHSDIFSKAFAISLIFVTYAYSGWNAAAYIVKNISNPQKKLPKALLVGVSVVSVLYILIQIVILKNASFTQLQGNVEVAQIAATNIFGITGSKLFTICLGIILVSSISAMVWVGAIVSKAFVTDFVLHKETTNVEKAPLVNIWFQAIISIAFILTNSFEYILTNCGLALQICVLLTVISLFKVRKHNSFQSVNFKSPFYPIPQVIFIAISIWIISFTLYSNISSFYFLLGLIILSIILYAINNKIKQLKYV